MKLWFCWFGSFRTYLIRIITEMYPNKHRCYFILSKVGCVDSHYLPLQLHKRVQWYNAFYFKSLGPEVKSRIYQLIVTRFFWIIWQRINLYVYIMFYMYVQEMNTSKIIAKASSSWILCYDRYFHYMARHENQIGWW